MKRKDLDYLVIAAMIVSGLYTAISGLVADLFGFPRFALHAEAGYVCTALAALHLALNGRRVAAYLQRLHRRKRPDTPKTAAAQRAPLLNRRNFLISAASAVGGFVLGRIIPGRRTAERPGDAADLNELYHQWSTPGYAHIVGALRDWGEQPERHKAYPEARQIHLPSPKDFQGLTLEEAIEARRSVRDYAGPLSLEALSRLLHAAQGVTQARWGLRAAPSAGALYPIELYAVVHDVSGLEAGIYHYAVQEHRLEMLQTGDFRAAITRAGLGQAFLGQANVCFVLSAIFQRTRWKYRERTYRYVMLEAGHVGQNLCLAAVSMGLGACPVGAFLDDPLNDLLALDGADEAALYIISVG